MEIQRQSDTYGLDTPAPRHAQLSAAQISDLTRGPQITPGLLNTRTASGFDFGKGPADHGGAGPDGGPTNPPEYYEDEPDEDEEEFFDPHHGDPERYIPEGDVADGPLSPHYPHVSDADIAEYEEYLDRHNYRHHAAKEPGVLGGSDTQSMWDAVPKQTGIVFPSIATARGVAQNNLEGDFDPSLTGSGDDVTPLNKGPVSPSYTASYRYADGVDNDLLQAEGDELATIGQYQEFEDEAKAAGDDHAAEVFDEALHDEHDHAKNFGDALRQSYRY